MTARTAFMVVALPAIASAQIAVGRNVQVSAARGGDTHYEAMVAADPLNPLRLIAGLEQPSVT